MGLALSLFLFLETASHGIRPMAKCIILLIEIQNSLRQNLCQHLSQEGYEVCVAQKDKEVIDVLSKKSVQGAILGLEGLKLEGLTLLRLLRKRYPALKVITLNSPDRFDFSLECMRLGVYDDFLIPFDLDTLMASLKEATGAGSTDASTQQKENDGACPSTTRRGGNE